jgi:diaminopimelate decarboxylase
LEQRLPRLERLRPALRALAREHGTPCYVYDAAEARQNLERFAQAFAAAGIAARIFYAIKSNPYPGLLRTIATAGHGLDAASSRELRSALDAGARQIVFTGPAKSRRDYDLLLDHHDRVTVHLDSPREIEELGQLAAARGVAMRCAMRIHTPHQGGWRKFGVPLSELGACFALAERHPQLQLRGIHFHASTSEAASAVVGTLELLSRELRQALPPATVAELEFVDIGGGIAPEAFEGVYPWNRDQVMSFASRLEVVERILADGYPCRFEVPEVEPVETVAATIAAGFRRHLLSVNPELELYTEPGKFISHSVMHLLLRVVDVKGADVVIVDGGTNMVGWEKYEFFDYVPIFNLDRFAPQLERPVLVYGSLCTPHDLWGYYVRGSGLASGDVLCLPYQGAYTYTLAQEFIRPVPQVVALADP